jgi:hypothetical protein
MSELTIGIDLQNDDIAEEIRDNIVDGIEAATDKHAKEDGLGEQVKEAAATNIRQARAVWTGELLAGFEIDHDSAAGVWRVTVENTAEHAAPIEYGAEYGEEGPPVAALIPWVEAHRTGFDPPTDELDGIPEPERIREQSADVSYGPDVFELAEPEIVRRAFWLQQHIKENGIDAIHYMARAEREVLSNADEKVAAYISARL